MPDDREPEDLPGIMKPKNGAGVPKGVDYAFERNDGENPSRIQSHHCQHIAPPDRGGGDLCAALEHYRCNHRRLTQPPAKMTPAVLSSSGLRLGYGDSSPVVDDVRFQLTRGDVFAVVGHNGSGKSTLIKTILGTLRPLAGKLEWAAAGRPKTIAYLGQQTEFDNRFPIRVRDLAAMGAWAGLGMLGRVDRDCQIRIGAALERTGTSDIADMPLHHLSAGQLQRALFARTMVQDAPLILLDEPFTAVDQTTESELLSLIDEWAAEGRTVILVLHDLSAVLQHCTAALLLGNGKARFGAPRETLSPVNLVEHGYLSASQAAWMEAMYVNQEDVSDA